MRGLRYREIMAISEGSEEHKTYESLRPDLIRKYPGKFAVVCGRRLLGVYEGVDDAMLASSRAFDADELPDGAAVLITEIAEPCSLRVMARPYSKNTPLPTALAG